MDERKKERQKGRKRERDGKCDGEETCDARRDRSAALGADNAAPRVRTPAIGRRAVPLAPVCCRIGCSYAAPHRSDPDLSPPIGDNDDETEQSPTGHTASDDTVLRRDESIAQMPIQQREELSNCAATSFVSDRAIRPSTSLRWDT